jgi:hypothetical protein
VSSRVDRAKHSAWMAGAYYPTVPKGGLGNRRCDVFLRWEIFDWRPLGVWGDNIKWPIYPTDFRSVPRSAARICGLNRIDQLSSFGHRS